PEQGRAFLGEASRLRLSAANEALNELLLRENAGYYRQYFADCRTLAEEGAALLGQALLGQALLGDALRAEIAALPRTLDDAMGFEAASPLIADGWSCLAQLVAIATQREDEGARAFIDATIRLEHRFHEHRRTASMTPEQIAAPKRAAVSAERFSEYLAQKFPGNDASVSQFKELVGGFQKTTVLFTLDRPGKPPESLVMRLEKLHEKYVILDAGTVDVEFDVVRFIHDKGIASAEPKWLETDSEAMGAPFMVTSHVAGRSIKVTGVDPDLVPPAERLTDATLKSVVETLARVHALPVGTLEASPIGRGLRYSSLTENTRATVESLANQRWSAEMMRSPTVELAFDWLRKNVPADDDAFALVHVDYGLHNILVDSERVSAVLDWESARIGDPAEDLAYLMQSLGPTVNRDDLIAWYEAASGRKISIARLRYFDVYNALKVLLAGCHASALFEHDPRAGMEWCSLALFIFLYGAAPLQDKIAAAESAEE
ncbi:MAG: phosphotransferase family protein, partial [Hyphomicrobiales bacterium]